MSPLLTLMIIVASSIMLVLFGEIAINTVCYIKCGKYEKEYKTAHNIEMNTIDRNAMKYAHEKIKDWRLYGLCTYDRVAISYIGIAMIATIFLLIAADASANESFDELYARKEKMMQNASITRHADLDAITEFNNEVFATYNEIPPIDRRIFVDNERNIYEELIIPYDETWYENKA